MKWLPLIFLFAGSAVAANLADGSKSVAFDDFSGGLNTRTASHKLPANQTPDAANGLIDEVPFSIVKRKGMRIAGSCPFLGKVNFIKEFVPESGSKGVFLADSSRVVYTTDFMNYTIVKSTLTTTAKLRAAQGLGYMLFTNGADPVFISSGGVGVPLDGNHGRVNLPRSKFTAFYLERFFFFNSTASSTQLAWATYVGTDGVRLAIADPRTLDPVHSLEVGQSDGAPGSGMDVYSGLLRLHKRNSAVYSLFGTDDFTFSARPTNKSAGTAVQESIVQADNLEYFFEKEGVRAFDGQDAVRISDDIFPDMEAVASNLTNIQAEIWDDQSDYTTAISSFVNSSATPSGLLTLDTSSVAINEINPSAPSASDFLTITGVGSSPYGIWIPTVTLPAQNTWQIKKMTIFARNVSGGANGINVRVKNNRTNKETEGATGAMSAGGSFAKEEIEAFADLNGQTAWTTRDLELGHFQVQYRVNNGGEVYDIFAATTATYARIDLQPVTTGQYLSQITTIATVTAWDRFDATLNTNGGVVSFYIRTSTTPTSISTKAWTSITPGSLISSNAEEKYVQWAATITAPTLSNSPEIDSVSLSYNEGGASDSEPSAVEWKKRYWLLCSTVSSGNPSLIYVKSRITNATPNAWMKYNFTNDYFKSIGKFNDNLYLGSGSTGTVYRMDFGTNDDGEAIRWYYDTPDNELGARYFKKNQSEYLVDVNRYGSATLTIGTSVDEGGYSDKTVDISGTGRLFKSIKNVVKIGKTFRYRFGNSELDVPIQFNGFAVLYEQTQVRD